MNTTGENNDTNNVPPDVIQDLCDAVEKTDVKITFGIQPKHIERIESEIKRWDDMLEEGDALQPGWRKWDKSFWDKMGKEAGWCPLTLALHYFEYLSLNTKTL